MRASPGSRLVLAVLLAAALGAARAQNTVLVLRRDWTPSTCSVPDVTCKEHPDSFSIFALYQADVASRQPQTGCAGKPSYATPDLTAAGLALGDVGCAFQNYDPGTTSLEPVWQYHWDQYGACTPAATAASYFRQGLDLDRWFPLPQDIASGTTGAQLAGAIQAAYNATPVVACDAPDRLLRFVVLCFEPASGGIRDCPWPTEEGCRGPLRVPRTGRGAGFPACQNYYPPSPVSPLLAGSPAPQLGAAAAPSPAPAATSPPAAADPPAVGAADPPAVAPSVAVTPSPRPSPPESPPPTPPPASPPAAPPSRPPPSPQPALPPPSPAPPSPAPPSPAPPSPAPPSPASPLASRPPPSPESPPPALPPPSPAPLPPPPSPANPAPQDLVPLEASGSGNSSGGGGGGTSTGAKVGALVGGIVGGMLLGAAVLGASYRAYVRCAAGGSKGTAGSTSGPLLEPGSASDTPRQTLPLYRSSLPPVPE